MDLKPDVRTEGNDIPAAIDVAGTFEAPQGPYAWLNDVQTFGRGVRIPEGVRYYFYRFR